MTDPNSSTAKTCPGCDETFEDVAANFHRNRAQRDGFSPHCKSCKKSADKPSEARKEKRRAYARERMRRLREEQAERVKAEKLAYRERNRERIAAKDAEYRRARRETVNAKARARHQLDREARNAVRREYYASNDEAASKRRWRAANPERARAQLAKSRAKRLEAPGGHTGADVRAVYEEQGGLCRWCGVAVGEDYHVDHIIPLSRGGSNWPENICIACPDCNLRKWAHPPEEFVRRLAG